MRNPYSLYLQLSMVEREEGCSSLTPSRETSESPPTTMMTMGGGAEAGGDTGERTGCEIILAVKEARLAVELECRTKNFHVDLRYVCGTRMVGCANSDLHSLPCLLI